VASGGPAGGDVGVVGNCSHHAEGIRGDVLEVNGIKVLKLPPSTEAPVVSVCIYYLAITLKG
jgi:hypothetical protein